MNNKHKNKGYKMSDPSVEINEISLSLLISHRVKAYV